MGDGGQGGRCSSCTRRRGRWRAGRLSRAPGAAPARRRDRQWLESSQPAQVIPVADPVSGRRSIVLRDEYRVAAVEPGVPGPGRVGTPMLAGPGNELIHPADGAVVLAER